MERVEAYRKRGCSPIYGDIKGQPTSLIGYPMPPQGYPNMIRELQALDMACVMLTGDSHQTTAYVAVHAGISKVHTQCLPEKKLAVVEECKRCSKLICMVGDGVNDAAALIRAHVGIVMG